MTDTPLLQGAHYVDIVVRRNGRDEHHEGDFLRALAVLADPGDTPPTLAFRCAGEPTPRPRHDRPGRDAGE